MPNKSRVDTVQTFTNLVFFYDLCRVLEGKRSLAEAAPEMRARGWGDKSLITKKLQALENELRPPTPQGTEWELIRRTQGRSAAEITDHGKALFRDISQLIEHQENLVSGMTGRKVVTIGSTNAFTFYHLPPVLAETGYLRRNSSVDLNVIDGEWWELLDHLHAQRVCLILGPHFPSGSGLVAKKLFESSPYLIYPRNGTLDEKLKYASRFQVDLLKNETVLTLPKGYQPSQDLDFLLRDPSLEIQHVTVHQQSELRTWVQNGLGVAIVYDRHLTSSVSDFGDKVGSLGLEKPFKKISTRMYLRNSWKRDLQLHEKEFVKLLIKHMR